ncbi:hypothetical protein VTK26DRAFT_4136 [Humicola hyalothermophila]
MEPSFRICYQTNSAVSSSQGHRQGQQSPAYTVSWGVGGTKWCSIPLSGIAFIGQRSSPKVRRCVVTHNAWVSGYALGGYFFPYGILPIADKRGNKLCRRKETSWWALFPGRGAGPPSPVAALGPKTGIVKIVIRDKANIGARQTVFTRCSQKILDYQIFPLRSIHEHARRYTRIPSPSSFHL